jgi:hypothetical protein
MRFLRIDTLTWKRALAELTLIVLGVLIALGANSWWENRSDRQRERSYLRQLLADVSETEVRLQQSIRIDSANLALVSRFLDAAGEFHAGEVDRAAAPPADSLGSWAVTAYASFIPLSGTYSALVQDGAIQLLRSDSLRFHIIAYAATIASAQEVLRHTEAQVWRNSEQVNLRFWHNVMQPTGTRRWRDALNAEELLRDSPLLTAMTMQRQVGENRLGTLRSLREPTAALRRMLEGELDQ